MATTFSLISLLVCIQRTSASTSYQTNLTEKYTPILSTPTNSLQPSSSSISIPSSSWTNSSTSTLPTSNPVTSLDIIASSSTPALYSEMMTPYTESPNSSTTFETSEVYIVTTEEIWLQTLDAVIADTSTLPSSTSVYSNASNSLFQTPSPSSTSIHSNASTPLFLTPSSSALPSSSISSSSPDAISGGSNRTMTLYPQPSTTSVQNGSAPVSPTKSRLHTSDDTPSIIYTYMTSFVEESNAIFMTASSGGNMSASFEQVQQSSQIFSSSDMNMTATSWIYETPVPTTIPTGSSSTPWNASRTDVLSAMPSTPMSFPSTVAAVSPSMLPDIFPTNATLATDTTVTIKYVQIQCTLVLVGDCTLVLAKKDAFKTNFTKTISSLLSLDPWRISVKEVKCGSVIIDFTLEDTIEGDFAEDLYDLMDTSNISVPFEDQNMLAEDIVFHNGPYADATPSPDMVGPISSDTPPVSDGDGGGLTFAQQQRLIYILIGVVVGFVILLAIVLVVHHVMRKTCSKSTQSFDLQDEPCIKLTDFNMAHTCIPRPRSIYSSIGADGRFFRYDQEDIGNPPGSPTSFIYADSQDIKEHYHEVIDPDLHDPLTSSLQKDFGQSGLPEWNLPLIDGAAPISPGLLKTIDSHHSSQPSTSSDTFRPPSTSSSTLNNAPVFSPPAPPPPPPPPLPTPVIQSGTLRSRTSCDASSEMTDSSGDTNTLTRGSNSDFGTSMMGIDNPLMTPEEDYDIPGPSTSGRMSKYVVH